MGKDAVNSIQFLPGGSFRASFSSRESSQTEGVLSSGAMNVPFGPPVTLKWMYISIIIRLRQRMRISVALCRVPCRLWYKGQPMRCNICREIGHMAASCPNKGLCRRCKEPALRHGTPPKVLFRRSPVLLRLALPPLRRPNPSRGAPLTYSLPGQTRSIRLKKRSVS